MNSTSRRFNIFSRIKLFALVAFSTFTTYLVSQTSSSSPYSRYAFGEITSNGTAQSFFMGGSGVATQNATYGPYFINAINPASYAKSNMTIFEAGVTSNNTMFSDQSKSAFVNNTAINYLSFLVPVTKWWGSSVGFKPFSNVGYKITNDNEINGAGHVDYLYEGYGGINEFYWGNGFTPFVNSISNFKKSAKYKSLVAAQDYVKIKKITNRKKAISGISFGANANYLFGNLVNTRYVILPDTTNSYNFKTIKTTRVNDLMLNYGLQYALTIDTLKGKALKDKVTIVAGVTATLQTNISATNDILSYTYEHSTGYINGEKPKDTLENTSGVEGNIIMPLNLTYGISVRKGDKWLFSADYNTQSWNQYSFFGEKAELKNTMGVVLGARFVPNAWEGKKYYEKIAYHAGARYNQTPIEINGTRVNETALSLGVGLPVGRSKNSFQSSVLSLGFELGQRGTTENGLVRERFAKVVVGFTMNDKWFNKVKFD